MCLHTHDSQAKIPYHNLERDNAQNITILLTMLVLETLIKYPITAEVCNIDFWQ
jgi:hypothetical protein